jgi:hypothetical protein
MLMAMKTRALLILLCLTAPALAQPAKSTKPPSLEARVEALEKENAALRADLDRLQRQLYGTRAALSSSSSLAAQASLAPTIQPKTVQEQQAETNAIIQQNNLSTQMNNLQLQQNMMADRQREQQLFLPQPYGAMAPPVPLTPNPPMH